MRLHLAARFAEAKELRLTTMSSNPDTRPNSLAVPHTCGAGQTSSGPEIAKLGEVNPNFVPTSYIKKVREVPRTIQVKLFHKLLEKSHFCSHLRG